MTWVIVSPGCVIVLGGMTIVSTTVLPGKVVTLPGSVLVKVVPGNVVIDPGSCWVTVTISPGCVDTVVDVIVSVVRLPEILVVVV